MAKRYGDLLRMHPDHAFLIVDGFMMHTQASFGRNIAAHCWWSDTMWKKMGLSRKPESSDFGKVTWDDSNVFDNGGSLRSGYTSPTDPGAKAGHLYELYPGVFDA